MSNKISQKTEDDYIKYRGKCKEFCESLILENPELELIRGYYMCPLWGEQPHWWCKDKEGNIVDPTVNQFPTKGSAAEYIEFDGNVNCSNCDKVGPENEFSFEGNYAFCSYACYGQFVL